MRLSIAFLLLRKMKSESASELGKIFHGIKSTANPLEDIRCPIASSEDLFVYMLVLLDPRSRREWENFVRDSSNLLSYVTMKQFFERHLHTLESMSPAKPEDNAIKSNNARATRSHLARKQEIKSEGKPGRCAIYPIFFYIAKNTKGNPRKNGNSS